MSDAFIECPRCKHGVWLKPLAAAPASNGKPRPRVTWYACPECARRYAYAHEDYRLTEASSVWDAE